MNSYAALCDDFGVSMYLNSKLELPTSRETILHFFEAIHKAQPSLSDFEKRSDDEYYLEEERDDGSYRWVSLDRRRLCCGYVNPPSLADADQHIQRILEIGPYHLDLALLQTESLDVMYHFDLLYQGNHDEVVIEALAAGTPLESVLHMPQVKVLNFQPNLTIALDDTYQLQCRVSIETRTNAYHLRTGNIPEAPISVYATVRQFWGKQPHDSYIVAYQHQRRVLDDVTQNYLVPHVIQPLARAIGAR